MGNKCVCDNHRGISLLWIAGKILVRMFLNRIKKHVINSIYPAFQCRLYVGLAWERPCWHDFCSSTSSRKYRWTKYFYTWSLSTWLRTLIQRIVRYSGKCCQKLVSLVKWYGYHCTKKRWQQIYLTINVQRYFLLPLELKRVLALVLFFHIFFSMILQHLFREYYEGLKLQFHAEGGGLLNLKEQCFRSKKRPKKKFYVTFCLLIIEFHFLYIGAGVAMW